MPRELITVQVGQCGNQVGCRFWDMALREHAANNPHGLYDEAMSSFFRNVDTRASPPASLPVGAGRGAIATLKARAVVVDMEEGVVDAMLRGPLGDLFDARAFITSFSGSGNNWAHGHHLYGPQYREALLESIRRPAEECDSLQSFLLLQSLGGGTGSGLGCYILRLLADEFPEVFRFAASVFPSEDDDVVTSPYNALLSLAELTRAADCVLPLENQALLDMCALLEARSAAQPARPASLVTGPDVAPAGAASGKGRGRAFDAMNGIAASMLLNLTSSMRFEGALNVDLNEITMNMVPYPRMHFLLSALSPLLLPKASGPGPAAAAAPRAIDQVFSEVFTREQQLMRCDPRRGTYLAAGLLARGACSVADLHRNTARLRPGLRFAHWNADGFKVGLCATPPVGVPFSLLGLANNCCVGATFAAMRDRFAKLHKRKFYLHHYTQYMEEADMLASVETVSALIDEYAAADGQAASQPQIRRLRPLGLSFV